MSHRPLTEESVLTVLTGVNDPETGRNLVRQGQVGGVKIAGSELSVQVGLTSHSAPLWPRTLSTITTELQNAFGPGVQVQVERTLFERKPQKLGEIGLTTKSVVAVGSGKGGVGKSTIAANVAYGLKRLGCHVGLMDADVYGPSLPQLLGVCERPAVEDGKIQPIVVDGMKVMSMGFLVPKGEAVVWRGPMLHGAITQFLRDTLWGDLDYLVIDLPPGTGDIALTLSQMLPLSGAVVVCTPQDVALLDAIKAIAMFRKVKIPMLGMVENMSYFLCPGCGKRYEIFGHGGARQSAEEHGVPFLGEVPIQISIRQHGDAGRIAGNYDDAQTAPFFSEICVNLAEQVAIRAKANPMGASLPVL